VYKKTQSGMMVKLGCLECKDDVRECSRCGYKFKDDDNIGCSELPDGAYYCEDCTIELKLRK